MTGALRHPPPRQWALYLIPLLCGVVLIAACCRQSKPPVKSPRIAENGSGINAPGETTAEESPAVRQPTTTSVASQSGPQLYTRHCAACHGERGDGNGLAATFVFPKPRDFRAGRFRLVSTSNSIPSRDDLHAVLLRGMPGSSMPPWKHLSQTERDALVDEVLRLRREGAMESYIRGLKEDDELTDEEIAAADVQQEIHDYAERLTTPGESSVVPEISPPDEAAVARGQEVYGKFGCLQCHGKDGKGEGVQNMFDDEKFPTAPRDFTVGIFKGGHDPASLYRRIAYGMPGTPMPSSSQMTPAQMIDLVHFLRSLSTEEQREYAVLNREKVVAQHVAAIPAAADDASWTKVVAAAPRTMPLWWRNNADIDLRVQAMHDGKSLAVRLSWHDPTQNSSAVRPDEFEDMAAVQLSAAGQEPFLGMGSADTVVDIWQWRAGLASTGSEDQLLDEYPFDTEDYKKFTAGKPLPDFVTARVAGNPLATRQHSGSNLAAKGLGSTTFRPPVSQVVTASGAWSDGRWSVVLVRPIDVKAGEGLSLAGGKKYAAAFAVWDGAAHDRAGQKLISIWNDLELE